MNSKNVSAAADARSLVIMGVEVNAEIADDEPHAAPQGLDRDLFKLICKHGLIGVLEALQDAALSSAEMNEGDDDQDLACLRARIAGHRLGTVVDALVK